MKKKELNNNPQKIFYMVYSLTSGGIEKYSINLFKNINKKKYTLDFITKNDRKEFFDDELYSMGGVKIPLGKKLTKSKICNMFKLFFNAFKVARKGYDLAYFNLSSPAAVFKYPLICKLAGIKKIIVHSHNSSEVKVGLGGKILNWLGRSYINKISSERFACSDKAAEWMYGYKVANNHNYTFVQNGIEVNRYVYNRTTRNKIRMKLGFTDETFAIGHIGRFETQKNHQFLIEVFNQLSKKDINAKLVLIGVGSLKSKIKKLVKEKKLEDRVLFLGEQNKINELLQALDVFVLPSLYEGLPVVGIEAQSAGLKCVFSNTITEEADITGNVKFVELNNVDSWVNAIEKCKNYIRKNQQKRIVNAGYDMRSTASLVQEKFDLVLSNK